MSAHDLYELANSLLRQNGYRADGSSVKGSSKRQQFFERKTIIMTPMGNRR